MHNKNESIPQALGPTFHFLLHQIQKLQYTIALMEYILSPLLCVIEEQSFPVQPIFSKQILVNKPISGARKNRREKGIWQNRFWEHLIRDERDFENYLHYNPVKHGYASKPVDWNYSSIHQFIKQSVLKEDWTCNKKFNVSNFGDLM